MVYTLQCLLAISFYAKIYFDDLPKVSSAFNLHNSQQLLGLSTNKHCLQSPPVSSILLQDSHYSGLFLSPLSILQTEAETSVSTTAKGLNNT